MSVWVVILLCSVWSDGRWTRGANNIITSRHCKETWRVAPETLVVCHRSVDMTTARCLLTQCSITVVDVGGMTNFHDQQQILTDSSSSTLTAETVVETQDNDDDIVVVVSRLGISLFTTCTIPFIYLSLWLQELSFFILFNIVNDLWHYAQMF